MCLDWLCGCLGGGSTKEPALVYRKTGRSCTDVLWLLAYVASWVVIISLIGAAAGKGGNPYKIIHGVDWNGRICGKDGGVEDKPYTAWPYLPSTSLVAQSELPGNVCAAFPRDASE
jgi:hypothetical protein